MVSLLNIAAGRIANHLCPVKPPFRKIFNLSNVCCWVPQIGVMHPLFQLVLLAAVSFFVDQQSEMFFKAKLTVTFQIFHLVFQIFRNGTETHGLQLVNCCDSKLKPGRKHCQHIISQGRAVFFSVSYFFGSIQNFVGYQPDLHLMTRESASCIFTSLRDQVLE